MSDLHAERHRLVLGPEGGRRVVMSSCRRYRWRLARWWGDGQRAVFVMLNPSTADEERDDPTVRRCIGFARSWGFEGVEIVNLFPWRTPHPAELVRAEREGIDVRRRSERDGYLAELVEWNRSTRLIAAWGAHPLADAEWPTLLRTAWPSFDGLVWTCLGVTASGAPKHPLARGRHRIPDGTRPVLWSQARAEAGLDGTGRVR